MRIEYHQSNVLKLLNFFHQNNGSVRQNYHVHCPFYVVHNRPSEWLIRITKDPFRTTFTHNDNLHVVRRQTVRTDGVVVYKKALKKIQINQLVAVLSNWDCVLPLYVRFHERILA